MPRPLPASLVLTLAPLALAACTVYTSGSATTSKRATTTAQTEPPPERRTQQAGAEAQGAGAQQTYVGSGEGSVRAQGSSAGAGVTIIETTCSSTEACNGLDDDCDGVIDEGCGYGTGAIQVTLGWASGADLDLYVTDPRGEVLSYRQTATSTGGVLDQDARGACDPAQTESTTENVFWDRGSNPPSGTYRVEVHYWGGQCSARSGPTLANLSIAVGGRVLGAYRVQLQPDERRAVANFTLR